MGNGNAKVGLKDISREAEVSISTVSHALNGTAPISEAVRNRVLQTAKRLGYLDQRRMRNRFVTSLSKLVLAVPDDALTQGNTNLFSWNILTSLRAECSRKSIDIISSSASGGTLHADAIIEAAKRSEANGVLVLNDDRQELLSALSDAELPMVLINGDDHSMTFDTVAPQNRAAGRLAAETLIRKGHRRMVHLTWNGRTTITRRKEGFLDGCHAHGIGDDNLRIVELPDYQNAAAEDYIANHHAELIAEGFTAIFCAADNLALGVLSALAAHNISVPDQMSVFGFDDIVLASLSNPPLTTISVPTEQIGVSAVKMLEQRIAEQDQSVLPVQRLELGCKLIERGSVADLT